MVLNRPHAHGALIIIFMYPMSHTSRSCQREMGILRATLLINVVPGM